MQLSAPEAMDISQEPKYIRKMYGLEHGKAGFEKQINPIEEADYFGRKCLVARRLLERGVRFVQIWSGNDNSFPRRNWDSHENIERDQGPLATGMAVGAAALIKDLKQRGMLEDTIILWTTEFGRMPSSQGSKGRDHNPYVFTNWLCGEEFEQVLRMANRTSGDTNHLIATIQHRSTISTPRFCTYWESIIENSRYATTASIGD